MSRAVDEFDIVFFTVVGDDTYGRVVLAQRPDVSERHMQNMAQKRAQNTAVCRDDDGSILVGKRILRDYII